MRRSSQPRDAVDANRAVLDAVPGAQEAMIRAATEVQAQATEKVYNEFLGPNIPKNYTRFRCRVL